MSLYYYWKYVYSSVFFLYCSGAHRDLHSFPTRRSSDLPDHFACGGAPDPLRISERCPPLSESAILASYPVCAKRVARSEEHTSELQSHSDLVCRLLLEKKKSKRRLYTLRVIERQVLRYQ